MSIKSSNQSQQLANKYRDIKGYLNSDNSIPARALLKETSELLDIPTNMTLLSPVKINDAELLKKTVKFYNKGQTFNVCKKDISDCYTVLLLNENNSKLIVGAVTFAPFLLESELLVYILLLKVKGQEQKKGNGTALFNIMKDFTMKCRLSTLYSKVLLLLSASTTLKPHGFFLKQGCEFVVDNDLLELTQKDSTLMQLKFVDQKCGDLFINERATNLQKNDQNTIATAIADTIQQYGTSSTTIKDQNEGGDGHEGRVSRDEETKQAINGQNGHQPDNLFDNIPHITPDSSNGNNNEIQEFKFPLNKRNLKVLNKQQEAVSDIGSKVSMASNKTSGGNINKHCEICNKKISGNHWSEHIKVHTKKGIDKSMVTFKLCVGDGCTNCQPNVNGKYKFIISNHPVDHKSPGLVTNHPVGITRFGYKSPGWYHPVGYKSPGWYHPVGYKSPGWLQITRLVSPGWLQITRFGYKSPGWYHPVWLQITRFGYKSPGLVTNHPVGITRLVTNHPVGYKSPGWYHPVWLQITRLVSPGIPQQQEQLTSIVEQSKHGHCKEYECQSCKKVKQSRLFPKNSKVCAVCDKKLKETKSAINVPLNNNYMMIDFGNDEAFDHQIDPYDSISMLGTKRLAKKPLELNEVLYEATNDEIQGEPLSSVVMPRQVQDTQTQSSRIQDEEMKDQSKSRAVQAAMTNKGDLNTIYNRLEEIETSEKSEYLLSIDVAEFCSEFTASAALSFLQNGAYDKLPGIISRILNSQGSQLKPEQLTGLFIAAFNLQGQCWANAVQMLSNRHQDVIDRITKIFKAHVTNLYGNEIAEWCSAHWSYVDEQQLNVMKAIKQRDNGIDVLLLSLVVQVDDIELFVTYTSRLAQRDFMQYMLRSVSNRLKQQKLSAQQFVNLTELVQQDIIFTIVEKNASTFEDIPLIQWQEHIDQYKLASHLMDSDSVQVQIQQYINSYGQPDSLFVKNMFSSQPSLELLLHESKNKANSKQLALAQYSIGTLRKQHRQLWAVPSGQGKGRIITFEGVLGLDTKMFNKIHIVFENEHLKNRDLADFEEVWTLLRCADKVQYHVGIDFKAEDNELIIIDESDTLMFEHPEKFAQLIDGRVCICLTATPDNCDSQGVESKVVKALNFKQYSYSPELGQVDAKTRLQLDDIIHVSTMQDKISYIQQAVQSSSILIYGPQELNDALIAAEIATITVDEQVDYKMLRCLDQVPYKVLFASNKFAMRGLDYRSSLVSLLLLIAQPFDNTREALQGVARVGRFGDPCKRVKFSDCSDIVDKKRELQYTAKLLQFIDKLSKKAVAKQVKVAVSQQRNTGGSNLSKKQVQAAQQIVELQKKQQQQQQQQKTIKDFITTNKNK